MPHEGLFECDCVCPVGCDALVCEKWVPIRSGWCREIERQDQRIEKTSCERASGDLDVDFEVAGEIAEALKQHVLEVLGISEFENVGHNCVDFLEERGSPFEISTPHCDSVNIGTFAMMLR